jgi:hypothetical protein
MLKAFNYLSYLLRVTETYKIHNRIFGANSYSCAVQLLPIPFLLHTGQYLSKSKHTKESIHPQKRLADGQYVLLRYD